MSTLPRRDIERRAGRRRRLLQAARRAPTILPTGRSIATLDSAIPRHTVAGPGRRSYDCQSVLTGFLALLTAAEAPMGWIGATNSIERQYLEGNVERAAALPAELELAIPQALPGRADEVISR